MTRKIFGFFIILLIISVIPVANAQISIGEKAIQKSVEVEINSIGDVHVKHVIRSSDVPRQMDLIDGTVSDLSVTDRDGKERQYSVIGDDKGVLIFPSKGDSIVEYYLDDVLSQTGDIWTWDFLYLETTSFILPEEIDLIFVNERPVYLDEKKGIACHGCQMTLEYSLNESKILENVKWKDKEFFVEIRSHSDVDKFVFDQPTKSITFEISEDDRSVIIIVPLELLWGPYEVFLDDEKINFHEYINNGTHAWLNMKPEGSGEILIIGTTVVPEFPIIAPLAIGFLMIMILPIIRKINHR